MYNVCIGYCEIISRKAAHTTHKLINIIIAWHSNSWPERLRSRVEWFSGNRPQFPKNPKILNFHWEILPEDVLIFMENRVGLCLNTSHIHSENYRKKRKTLTPYISIIIPHSICLWYSWENFEVNGNFRSCKNPFSNVTIENSQ